MIQITADEMDILNSDEYEVHTKILAGGVDVSAMVGYEAHLSTTVSGDLDSPTLNAEIQFALGEGSANLSPYVDDGAQWAGRPLLDAGQPLAVLVACVPPGETSRPYKVMFNGAIDRSDPAEGEDIVKVRCRDVFGLMLDYYFDTFTETDQGFMAGFGIAAGNIDETLQALLTKALAAGLDTPYNTVYVAGSPDLALGAYWQQQDFLLNAQRNLGRQFQGWDLRGRCGSNPFGAFLLTYYDPDRERTDVDVDWLGMNRRFAIQGMPKDRSNVRNRVTVVPADTARVPVTVSDADSILKYGLRPMVIAEDRASGIVDPTSALALANAGLSDLKDPKLDVGVLTRLLWMTEINDRYSLPANSRQFTTDITVAISGFTHTIPQDGMPTTLLRTRGKPAAANLEWTQGRSRQTYASLGEPRGPAKPGATWYELEDDALPTPL